MKRESALLGLACLAALGAGCGREASTSTQTTAAETVALMPIVDVASHAGQSFEAFSKSTGMERFALDKLDLAPDERTRIARAMAVSQPSRLISGGGGQALVFTGCAAGGCNTGLTVLAFGDHGEAFVGVHDAQGVEEFIPDDRMEALLRLNSASRRWDDPEPARSLGRASAP